MQSVEAGWFVPLKIHGIQLADSDGQLLFRVGQVATQKGLLGWITNHSDLGTIHVDGFEAVVVARDGSTNLEQALASLPALAKDAAPSDSASTSRSTGTVRLVDAKFLLMESGRPEQWVLQIPELTASLPAADQVLGPIQLNARIGEVSGKLPTSQGTLAAEISQSADAFEMHIQMQQLPLEFWHVVHARLPQIPIDELNGRVSAAIGGRLIDADNWSFDISQLESQDLVLVAPQLVGQTPAKLVSVAASGRASLANSVMQLEQAEIVSDVGRVNALASLPWPIRLPTAAHPFFEGAQLQAEGSVDLPKLVQAARSLLPLREDITLASGTAQFRLAQTLDTQASPAASANLTFSGLTGTAAGQSLTWDDPLTVAVAAEQRVSGLQLGANVLSEFGSLKGGGTLEAGQFQGKLDLALLQQRLSQWFDMPIDTMDGSAGMDLVWSLNGSDTLEAQGKLTTTPLRIATKTGGVDSRARLVRHLWGRHAFAARRSHAHRARETGTQCARRKTNFRPARATSYDERWGSRCCTGRLRLYLGR